MITIFTPTYNRAHTLSRLFESLQNQSLKSFEWIIIDDDSKDDTEKLVKSFVSKANFPIRYEKQSHGGKHRAINKAVKLSRHEWFFIVDSDDFLVPDAIKKIKGWINANENDKKIAAVCGSRYETNKKKALSVPSILTLNPGLKCHNHEREKYGLECDKAEVYRTDIISSHLFPEYEGEFFCTEAVCWDSISFDGYYIAFYPDVIYMCEYMDDGLTKNGANGYVGFSNNFYGFLDYAKIQIKCRGISADTFGLAFFALKVSKKKKIPLENLCSRLDLSKDELKSFIKKYRRNIFQKIIAKLYNIICTAK